ncbi:MAG: NAD(P)/FAD-dependent oxidoreductase, partial [Acidobacteriota bacterium]
MHQESASESPSCGQDSADPNRYDVVVIGGSLGGSSAATLVKRRLPEARILVVEMREQFPHKVGEATVEMSALFLHRVLQQYDHLSREHLPKHGLRYWFTDGSARDLSKMTEIGPRDAPKLPSFQLDRSKFDQHCLEVAEDLGVEVARPARVRSLELGWPESRLVVSAESGTREVTARWVIDASGRHAVVARNKGLLEHTKEHPVAASWGRWHGALDLDSHAALGDADEPRLPDIAASRRLATNHFCGRGWWSWVIPLSNGKTSIGVVYNKELFELPGEGPRKARYEAFVRSQPGLSQLVEGAELDLDDTLSYAHLPYRSSQYMDRGWALVGDAASFMDPYYSPGLDHLAISTLATVDLIADDLAGQLGGEPLAETELMRRVVHHNEAFDRSYRRWIDALYIGKYEILGDAELTASAFLVDTSLYYLGVVSPAYRDLQALRTPVFGAALPQATVAYKLARLFNRR